MQNPNWASSAENFLAVAWPYRVVRREPDDRNARLAEFVPAFPIETDRRIVDFPQEPRVATVARGDEIRPARRHPFLLALEVEVFAPARDRRTDARADAPDRFQRPTISREHRPRITAECLKEAVQGDRTDFRQGIEHEQGLLFGQLAGHGGDPGLHPEKPPVERPAGPSPKHGRSFLEPCN
jgi:hypothetical protein